MTLSRCDPDLPYEQVVDELSADGTSQQLAAAGVKFIQPLNASGVTFNWNMVCDLLRCGRA